jgi:hypothetical protein
MRDCIKAVQVPGDLFYPLMNLVFTFIDGLASGTKGRIKATYLIYLEAHFPDICSVIGAKTFYENYRWAAIHEFGLKSGYAIGRDSSLNCKYADTQVMKDTGQRITVLNVDRLVGNFLKHVVQLLGQAKPTKVT